MANAGAILIYDSRFEYDTELAVPRTACRLRLFEASGRLVALASELADSPGASITNMAAVLATALVRDYVVDPARVLLIEHYDRASYQGFSPEPSFDLLRFIWTANLAAHSSMAKTE